LSSKASKEYIDIAQKLETTKIVESNENKEEETSPNNNNNNSNDLKNSSNNNNNNNNNPLTKSTDIIPIPEPVPLKDYVFPSTKILQFMKERPKRKIGIGMRNIGNSW